MMQFKSIITSYHGSVYWQHRYLPPLPRYYHFYGIRDCLWPWEVLLFQYVNMDLKGFKQLKWLSLNVICIGWDLDLLWSTYMPNLKKSLFPFVTMIWNATQNVENGVAWVAKGHKRLRKIRATDRSIERIRVLISLPYRSSYLLIFDRFRDIVRKSQILV